MKTSDMTRTNQVKRDHTCSISALLFVHIIHFCNTTQPSVMVLLGNLPLLTVTLKYATGRPEYQWLTAQISSKVIKRTVLQRLESRVL